MTRDAAFQIFDHPPNSELPQLRERGGGIDSTLLAAFVGSELNGRLSDPTMLAVTTGQQPGLFGGPLYTVHKAMAARGVATELERRWKRPVVPIFWLAGDDHDWTEATGTAWWSEDGNDVRRWSLPPRDSRTAQLPMYREILPDDVKESRAALAQELPAGAEREQALAWIDRHWQPGVTVHAAYAGGLAELLAPFGIVCFDATSSAAKHAQRGVIQAALAKAGELDRILAALPDPETGIRVGEGATLVFLETDAGRDRLMIDGDRFVTRRGGESFEPGELTRLLASAPERFSANVLLRPVVEAAILPTVGYVAGAAEYRYLTRQASALYSPLGVTPQQPVARWGATVVDRVSTRLLDRLVLDVDEVIADDGSLGQEILSRELPNAIPEAVERLQRSIDDSSARLTEEGHRIDPVLERAIESRRRKLQFVTTDLERLIDRHQRKRDDIAYSQYRRLRSRLRPMERQQERVIGIGGAYGRWGGEWLSATADAAAAWATKAVRTPRVEA